MLLPLFIFSVIVSLAPTAIDITAHRLSARRLARRQLAKALRSLKGSQWTIAAC